MALSDERETGTWNAVVSALKEFGVEDPHPQVLTHLSMEARMFVLIRAFELLSSSGDYAAAAKMAEEAAHLGESCPDIPKSTVAGLLGQACGNYLQVQEFGNAETVARASLAITALDPAGCGDAHGASLCNLAMVYRYTGRFPEAEALLLESRDAWRGSALLPIALNNLCGLYETQGRANEAEAVERELRRIKASQ